MGFIRLLLLCVWLAAVVVAPLPAAAALATSLSAPGVAAGLVAGAAAAAAVFASAAAKRDGAMSVARQAAEAAKAAAAGEARRAGASLDAVRTAAEAAYMKSSLDHIWKILEDMRQQAEDHVFAPPGGEQELLDTFWEEIEKLIENTTDEEHRRVVLELMGNPDQVNEILEEVLEINEILEGKPIYEEVRLRHAQPREPKTAATLLRRCRRRRAAVTSRRSHLRSLSTISC